MRIVTTIPSQSLSAEGGRDINLIIAGVLAIAGFIMLVIGLSALIILNWYTLIGIVLLAMFLVYFLVAPKNTFNVGISPISEGSRISITSSGSKAEGTQGQLIGILRMVGMGAGAARMCKSCHATVTDRLAVFCPACGKKMEG